MVIVFENIFYSPNKKKTGKHITIFLFLKRKNRMFSENIFKFFSVVLKIIIHIWGMTTNKTLHIIVFF